MEELEANSKSKLGKLKLDLQNLKSRKDGLVANSDKLLKNFGQASLEGLFNSLKSIESLGRLLQKRTATLGKLLAFGKSFTLTIKSSMGKIKNANTEVEEMLEGLQSKV